TALAVSAASCHSAASGQNGLAGLLSEIGQYPGSDFPRQPPASGTGSRRYQLYAYAHAEFGIAQRFRFSSRCAVGVSVAGGNRAPATDLRWSYGGAMARTDSSPQSA